MLLCLHFMSEPEVYCMLYVLLHCSTPPLSQNVHKVNPNKELEAADKKEEVQNNEKEEEKNDMDIPDYRHRRRY